MNNNLATISYNASCFDFTSDFFNSLKQNEETMIKAADSLRSLSNKNNNADNKTIYNKYVSNKNKNKNVNIDAKTSKFSFENDLKNSQNFIKINVSNVDNNDRNYHPRYIKKNNNNKNKESNMQIKRVMKVQLRKNNTNYYNNNYSSNFLSSKNGKISNHFSDITQSILENNKENNHSISNFDEYNKTKQVKNDFTDITLIRVKKLLDRIKPKMKNNNKTYIEKNNLIINKNSLRGEDIFRPTNNNNIRKCKNISLLNRNIQIGVRSTDYKNFKENPIHKIKTNFSINYLNKIEKKNLK
jgi:hypothetical protein